MARWVTLRDDVPGRGYWDQALLEDLLDGWDSDPVAVVPGAAHADLVDRLRTELDGAAVLVVAEDEGSEMDYGRLGWDGPLFVQTARSDRTPETAVWLPVGYTPATRPTLATLDGPGPRDRCWMFAGQVAHPRRREAQQAMGRVADGDWVTTGGFLQGDPPDVYTRRLAGVRFVPCPAGIITPDTFRVWETLEAGAVPLADRHAGEWDVPGDYWERLCGPPFPIVDNWGDVPDLVAALDRDWAEHTARIGGWWSRYKQTLRRRLATAAGVPAPDVTAVVTCSPIPSHPDTTIVDRTVASIRDQCPDAPILVGVDGVRPEDSELAEGYWEHARRVVWSALHRWDNVAVYVAPGWLHQANLARRLMAEIVSPLVLFVEHDTPFDGAPIDWPSVRAAVTGDVVDVVRFHHEAQIPESHQGLMRGPVPGWPLLATAQWSQRPHIARTDWYRSMLAERFDDGDRTMIEDVVHSDAQTDPDRFRLAIYSPPAGTLRRTLHLDGRAGRPKHPMSWHGWA